MRNKVTQEEKELLTVLKEAFETTIIDIVPNHLIDSPSQTKKVLKDIKQSINSSMNSVAGFLTPKISPVFSRYSHHPKAQETPFFEKSNEDILRKTLPAIHLLKERISENIHFIIKSPLFSIEQKTALKNLEHALEKALETFIHFTEEGGFLKANLGLDVAKSARDIFLDSYTCFAALEQLSNTLDKHDLGQKLTEAESEITRLETSAKQDISELLIETFVNEGEAQFHQEVGLTEFTYAHEALQNIAAFLLPILKNQPLTMVSTLARQSVKKILSYTENLPTHHHINSSLLIEGFIAGNLRKPALFTNPFSKMKTSKDEKNKANTLLANLLTDDITVQTITTAFTQWQQVKIAKENEVTRTIDSIKKSIHDLEQEYHLLRQVNNRLELKDVSKFLNSLNEEILSELIIETHLQPSKLAYTLYQKEKMQSPRTPAPKSPRNSRDRASSGESDTNKKASLSLAKDEKSRKQQAAFNHALIKAKNIEDLSTKISSLNELFTPFIQKNQKEVLRIDKEKEAILHCFNKEEAEKVFHHYRLYKDSATLFESALLKLRNVNKFGILKDTGALYDEMVEAAMDLYALHLFFNHFTAEKLAQAKLSHEKYQWSEANDPYTKERWASSSKFYQESKYSFTEGFLQQLKINYSAPHTQTLIASVIGVVAYIYRDTFKYLSAKDAHILGKSLAKILGSNYTKLNESNLSEFSIIQNAITDSAHKLDKQTVSFQGKEELIADILMAYTKPEIAAKKYHCETVAEPTGLIRNKLKTWELDPENEIEILELGIHQTNAQYLELLLGEEKNILTTLLDDTGNTMDAVIEHPLLKEVEEYKISNEEGILDSINILQKQAVKARVHEVHDLMISDQIQRLEATLMTLKTKAIELQKLRQKTLHNTLSSSISDRDAVSIQSIFASSQPLIKETLSLSEQIKEDNNLLSYHKVQTAQKSSFSMMPGENFQKALEDAFFTKGLLNTTRLRQHFTNDEALMILAEAVFKHYEYVIDFVEEKDLKKVIYGIKKSLSFTLQNNQALQTALAQGISAAIAATENTNKNLKEALAETIIPSIHALIKENEGSTLQAALKDKPIALQRAFHSYLPKSVSLHDIINGHFKEIAVHELIRHKAEVSYLRITPEIMNELAVSIETYRNHTGPNITTFNKVIKDANNLLEKFEEEEKKLIHQQGITAPPSFADTMISDMVMISKDEIAEASEAKQASGQINETAAENINYLKQFVHFVTKTIYSFSHKALHLIKSLLKRREPHLEASSPLEASSQIYTAPLEVVRNKKKDFSAMSDVDIEKIHIENIQHQAFEPNVHLSAELEKTITQGKDKTKIV